MTVEIVVSIKNDMHLNRLEVLLLVDGEIWS